MSSLPNIICKKQMCGLSLGVVTFPLTLVYRIDPPFSVMLITIIEDFLYIFFLIKGDKQKNMR